jgi:hypothetical protein
MSVETTAQRTTAEPVGIDLQLDEETDLRWEELATEVSDLYNCAGSADCYGTSYPGTWDNGDTNVG